MEPAASAIDADHHRSSTTHQPAPGTGAVPAAGPGSSTAAAAPAPTVVKGPRGLEAGPEALGRWARFVEACFAARSPPPSHHRFLRRLNQDPHSGGAARPDMIRVMEDGEGNIVAAARLCFRQLEGADESTPTWAAGIAEVCVSAAHRGQGLAKRVVADALAHAAAAAKPEAPRVSLLHCQPHLVPVYHAMGYTSHSIPWRRLPLPRTPAAAAACAEALRAAGRYGATSLSASADLDEMAALHAAMPPADRGLIRRAGPYFEFWIQGELSSLPPTPAPVWGVRDATGRLVAYAVFRCPAFSPSPAGSGGNDNSDAGAELVVLDMGCLPEERPRARLFLRALALAAARGCPEPGGVRAVRCPAAALPAAVDGREGEGEEEVVLESDVGWMARPLGGETNGEYEGLRASAEAGRLIWPIDHF